ncbi:Hypothetical protein PBC10988_24400 [Planctomycetales bacterium 10988]|nr:Hypothetical protein PBC10988_24400 [Planctomycetales bacterium 10988]
MFGFQCSGFGAWADDRERANAKRGFCLILCGWVLLASLGCVESQPIEVKPLPPVPETEQARFNLAVVKLQLAWETESLEQAEAPLEELRTLGDYTIERLLYTVTSDESDDDGRVLAFQILGALGKQAVSTTAKIENVQADEEERLMFRRAAASTLMELYQVQADSFASPQESDEAAPFLRKKEEMREWLEAHPAEKSLL